MGFVTKTVTKSWVFLRPCQNIFGSLESCLESNISHPITSSCCKSSSLRIFSCRVIVGTSLRTLLSIVSNLIPKIYELHIGTQILLLLYILHYQIVLIYLGNNLITFVWLLTIWNSPLVFVLLAMIHSILVTIVSSSSKSFFQNTLYVFFVIWMNFLQLVVMQT